MTMMHFVLGAAMAAFVGLHLLMSHPWRAGLVSRLGEQRFLGLYSVVSLVTLGAAMFAARQAPADPTFWVGGTGFWHSANIVMWFASILLVGSLFGNPALPAPDGQFHARSTARGVFAITRHPMMWSFILWGINHVLLVGSLTNLLLAGGIMALALFGAIGQDRKKQSLVGDPWRVWQSRTSFVPFAAVLSGRTSLANAWPGWSVLIGGTALFFAATWAHQPVGGLVVGPWMWLG